MTERYFLSILKDEPEVMTVVAIRDALIEEKKKQESLRNLLRGA